MKRKIDWKNPSIDSSMTELRYFYPNRPILIPPDPNDPLNPSPDYLTGLERSGKYVAERKYNGDNAMIFTSSMEFWNRKKSKLRYTPTDPVLEELQKLPKNCLINAEIVHYHTKTVKDLIIVHCIMSYKGEPLIGKTWADSRAIIEDFTYGEHVQLSKLYTSNFFDLWKEADGTVIEGIILKDPSGKLQFSQVPLADVSWMLKVRKPCKKYSF